MTQLFGHVQVQELHDRNAVLALPMATIHRLEVAEFVAYNPAANPPFVSQDHPVINPIDDMLLQIPDGLIIRRS